MRHSTENRFLRPLLAAVLTTAFLLAGCGMGGTGEFPPATEILRVEVEPNPVAAGDTAVFTCVIEDSLKSEFTFRWNLINQTGITTTDTNQYRWEAPSDTGRYHHQVEVDKPGADVTSVQKPFEVTVTENS